MAKWLKRIGIALVVLVAVLVLVAVFLPSSYRVERSVVIAAPAAEIHRLVGDLERWDEWTPWLEADPTIVTTFGDITQGVGASQSWTGDSGDGELTFTHCDPATGVTYEMSFDEGAYRSVGSLLYAPAEGGTRVTWNMEGEVGWNLVGRYFGVMMDGMAGPMFEDGLAKLKSVSESGTGT